MEALSEVDSEEDGRAHRTIARYLKHFLEYIPEEVAGLLQAMEEEAKNPQTDDLSTGTPYMEDDGTEDESPNDY